MDNKRNSDLAMTSESLLHTNNNYCSAGNYKPHKGPSEAARRRRRVCLAITAVLCMVLLVLLCLFLGSLPFFVGLAVVFPVLGHATWHLYRKVVRF